MAIEDALDLDGGNIFAAGNDDVFQSVLDFDVAVRVPDSEIAGVEPTSSESLAGRIRIFQIRLD
jgi:hypothetical protein